MEENNEKRWYISNGTCSWFNQLHVLDGVHKQGTPENSWDNSIWFNNKQDAEDFNEQLQNFINKNYFEKKKKS